MPELITATFYDIGQRDLYEDRVEVRSLITVSGQPLCVAAVADGVGGAARGERAAQLALEALFHYLTNVCQSDEIPRVLQEAIMCANETISAQMAKQSQGATTLAVAAIHAQKTLYVANVGDSCVYLCREGRLYQLTLDHNFANVAPWLYGLSREAASHHPSASTVVWALGIHPPPRIDLGIYWQTDNPRDAMHLGHSGLQLNAGDSIIVCSDGLIKKDERGRRYIGDKEIVDVVENQSGDKAARTLVSLAMGRNADDNVSVALLQLQAKKRRPRIKTPFRFTLTAILILSIVLTLYWRFNDWTQSRLENSNRQQLAGLQGQVDSLTTELAAARSNFDITQATATAETAELLEAKQEAESRLLALGNQVNCYSPDSYMLEVGIPTLSPPPNFTLLTNDDVKLVDFQASWPVTNNGTCDLYIDSLLQSDTNQIPLNISLLDVEPIPAGRTGTVSIRFQVSNQVEAQALRDAYRLGIAWHILGAPNPQLTPGLVSAQSTFSLSLNESGTWFKMLAPTPVLVVSPTSEYSETPEATSEP